ncbi:hypothetical protein [Nannocystis punicea]|uniref:WD40-like Beta Propeller Repeat n=1 Tax=Nannocystis punicea TaxID=2995304 RepID=A0ABY7HBA0_9BACT|nr:hypothetical protein [Nannocystis poenicansa]WAS96554.1 hypothetical protein O0S08_10385 [Nannocystis poenicansa]
MSATPPVTITIDLTTNLRAPDAVLPVGGTLGFMPSGNLLVLKRLTSGRAEVYEFTPGEGSWTEVGKAEIKSSSGSRAGGAISPDGTRCVYGPKTAKVYGWPGGKAMASLGAVKYSLGANTVGFSPSGAWVVVADNGRISPRQRTVTVFDAGTGEKRAAIKTDEWCFVQAGMLDDDTVVTLGLHLDWDVAKGWTDDDLVLGCYDVTTGAARWRRKIHDGQRFALEPVARQVWIADDGAPHGTGAELCLAADDGRVLRSIAFSSGWRAGRLPPVVVRPGLVAVGVVPVDGKPQDARFVLLDLEAGRQVATLGEGRGTDYNFDCFATAHTASQWLASVDFFGNETYLWRLA